MASVADKEIIGPSGHLVAGIGADKGGDNGEDLGVVEMCAPSYRVEENEREDAGFGEDEGEEDDDGELSTVAFYGVVERWWPGGVVCVARCVGEVGGHGGEGK